MTWKVRNNLGNEVGFDELLRLVFEVELIDIMI